MQFNRQYKDSVQNNVKPVSGKSQTPNPAPRFSRDEIRRILALRAEIDKLAKRLRYIDEMKRKAEIKTKRLVENHRGKLAARPEDQIPQCEGLKEANTRKDVSLKPEKRFRSANDNRLPDKSFCGGARKTGSNIQNTVKIGSKNPDTKPDNLKKAKQQCSNENKNTHNTQRPKTGVSSHNSGPCNYRRSPRDLKATNARETNNKAGFFMCKPSQKTPAKTANQTNDVKALKRELKQLKAQEAVKLDELLKVVNNKSDTETQLKAMGLHV